MKLIEALEITEKPRGWSSSSYYRLRSAAHRLLKSNDCEIDVNFENLDSILNTLSLDVNYQNGILKKSNRTYKTYIAEVKRYIKYNLKNEKKWKIRKAG
ncbi:MAG: hypothetical protein IT250_11985 [Chitinophagaceae bacterium]|nr:hypothetical protein [Chitinophagaceae bacterium]